MKTNKSNDKVVREFLNIAENFFSILLCVDFELPVEQP